MSNRSSPARSCSSTQPLPDESVLFGAPAAEHNWPSRTPTFLNLEFPENPCQLHHGSSAARWVNRAEDPGVTVVTQQDVPVRLNWSSDDPYDIVCSRHQVLGVHFHSDFLSVCEAGAEFVLYWQTALPIFGSIQPNHTPGKKNKETHVKHSLSSTNAIDLLKCNIFGV